MLEQYFYPIFEIYGEVLNEIIGMSKSAVISLLPMAKEAVSFGIQNAMAHPEAAMITSGFTLVAYAIMGNTYVRLRSLRRR